MRHGAKWIQVQVQVISIEIAHLRKFPLDSERNCINNICTNPPIGGSYDAILKILKLSDD